MRGDKERGGSGLGLGLGGKDIGSKGGLYFVVFWV